MKTLKTEVQNSLPPSSTNYRFNLLCLVLFFVVMGFFLYHYPHVSAFGLAVICLFSMLIPLWLYDFCQLKVHQRLSTGLLKVPGQFDRKRLVIKLIGLYATYLIVLLLYYVNPFYRESARAIEFYRPFFYFLNLAGPWIVILSFIYFWQIDRRQKDPYDSYWHMGCLLTGRFKEINPVYLQEHSRVWFIKAFFTPIMFALLVDYLRRLLSFDWSMGSITFFAIYNHLLDFFYTFDVIYGLLGYLLTLRLLDTHIQSTEMTFLGWFVCLACYYPFSAFFGIGLLSYQSYFEWEHWLAFFPGLYYVWGTLIIFLSLVYGLATVAFGYRMSNLTYRGIITSGPYRFTKHPAYLCKVASWWMISLPFFTFEGPLTAIKHTLCLSIISYIYFLRAKTEENHLSNYPEYVKYAQWINEHGLFSAIGKKFSALQYSEEKARRWKSTVWWLRLDRIKK